ncbi:elongation factor 1-beta [Blastomyces parvus]|uniref:Elongation factor 1-beta n=1 Tax=Blastomyces parvus TaxID=2060905 RepID=A0A2B7WXQ6_9EURO|nr:elongation factor 1-beta [Blastomyces parvus]
MGFTDFSSDSGLALANQFFRTRSYVEGYTPTQADVVTYKAFKNAPDAAKYPHVARWYKHIASYEAEFATLKGDPSRSFTSFGPESTEIPVIANKPAEDDDDMDLFGSESEEEDAALVAEREKNLADYRANKAAKEAKKAAEGKLEVARTTVFLSIKPCSDQSPLRALAAEVRALLDAQDYVKFTKRTFEPIGYGIWKLKIQFDVEDTVSIDNLEHMIMERFADPSELEDDEDDEDNEEKAEGEKVKKDTYGVQANVGAVKNGIRVEDVDEIGPNPDPQAIESTNAYEEAKKAREPAEEDEDGWIMSTHVDLLQKSQEKNPIGKKQK